MATYTTNAYHFGESYSNFMHGVPCESASVVSKTD